MQRLVIGKGGGVGGVVLNDNNLKVIVPSVFVQTGQTAVQILHVVLVGNQNADFWVAGQLIPHLERTGGIGHGHGVARQP